MTNSQCAQPAQVPAAWREFVERVAKQKPEKPDYWSSCGQCEHNANDAQDLLEDTPAIPAIEDLMTKIQAFGLACYQHESGELQIEMQDEIRRDLNAFAGENQAPEGASTLRAALAELLAAVDAAYPAAEEGHAAQVAWSERRAAASAAARAALAAQPQAAPEGYRLITEEAFDWMSKAAASNIAASPAEGDDMLEPLIYAAIMHSGRPKTIGDFEQAAANVADMLKRRGQPQPKGTLVRALERIRDEDTDDLNAEEFAAQELAAHRTAQAPALAQATLTITAPNGDKIVAHGSAIDMATLEKVIHAKTQAPAPEAAETMKLQEVWDAMGGNPGIAPSRADVLLQLKLLDQICDDADAKTQAPAVGAEPAPNDWRLPADLKAGHVTFRKGVHCSALVDRMDMLRERAFGPDTLTPEQKAENLAALQAGEPIPHPVPGLHPDDAAVDALAAAMKAKLADARAKGRSGWQTCPPEELSLMLREHVEKGDPRDVANFCAFLWSLGQGISLPPAGTENFDLWVSRGMGRTAHAPAVAPAIANSHYEVAKISNALATPSIDDVLTLADAHAEESHENGDRRFDRGGLYQFAKELLTKQKAIGVEVVGVVRPGGEDGAEVEWLLEGGLHAVAEGGEAYLLVSHEPLTNDDGYGEVYRASHPPVQHK